MKESIRKKDIKNIEFIVIGGSAGSLDTIISLISELEENFNVPILFIIHRLKNNKNKLVKLLQKYTTKKVVEVEDKLKIEKNVLYFAPDDYHVLIEPEFMFSLDYSHQINFSRPSINTSFESASTVYKDKLLGILLSGSNADGAEGLYKIHKANGTTFVQSPETTPFSAMPNSAMTLFKCETIKPDEISNLLNQINH